MKFETTLRHVLLSGMHSRLWTRRVKRAMFCGGPREKQRLTTTGESHVHEVHQSWGDAGHRGLGLRG